jgi:ribosomal protein L7/L12
MDVASADSRFEGLSAVEVLDCDRRAKTISAIKYIRELRGVNLGEAKRLIDEVYYGGRAIVLNFASESDSVAFADQMAAFGFKCRIIAK